MVTARNLTEAEAFFAQENAALGETLQHMINDAVREEDQSQAQAFAENEIAARLENGDVADFVEEFLQTHWLRVLEFGFGVRDAQPELLPQLLEAMDELVWSIRPKAGTEERKELLDRLPSMLAMLNAWLDVIEWQDAGREAFFAALAAHHAATMRAPAELTPRDQLEKRMDAVQRASEHQLARRAREDRQAALADFMPLVDGLVPGSWVELVRNNGGKVNCRVLWVGPARRRFIFVAASTRRLFMLSEETLAQALRAGRAAVIAPDRMVGQVLAMVSGNPGAV